MEEWAEVRRLFFAEGRSIKGIARQMGLARNTVRSAIRGVEAPRYARAPRGSIVDAVDTQIRGLLQGCPTMPASVIAERIGWTRGMTVLRQRIRELRGVYRSVEPYELRQRQHARPDFTKQIDRFAAPDRGNGHLDRAEVRRPLAALGTDRRGPAAGNRTLR